MYRVSGIATLFAKDKPVLLVGSISIYDELDRYMCTF